MNFFQKLFGISPEKKLERKLRKLKSLKDYLEERLKTFPVDDQEMVQRLKSFLSEAAGLIESQQSLGQRLSDIEEFEGRLEGSEVFFGEVNYPLFADIVRAYEGT